MKTLTTPITTSPIDSLTIHSFDQAATSADNFCAPTGNLCEQQDEFVSRPPEGFRFELPQNQNLSQPKSIWKTFAAEQAALAVPLSGLTAYNVLQGDQGVLLPTMTLGALMLTFGHIQLTNSQASPRLTLEQKHQLHQLSKTTLISKEVLWVLVFLMQTSYAAMIAPIFFALYPLVRRT